MQTFLPYADFARSAQVLDRSRLGKQRVEVLQLVHSLTRGGGWENHPAAKMWRGYVPALCNYGVAICDEWISRGYRDTCRGKLLFLWVAACDSAGLKFRGHVTTSKPGEMPPWLGNEAFHASHRSNLLRKKPEHYRRFGWTERNDLPYIWPVP